MRSPIHETGDQSEIRCPGNASQEKWKLFNFECDPEWSTPSHLPQSSHYSRTILKTLVNSFRRIVLIKICNRTYPTKGPPKCNQQKAHRFPKPTPTFSVWISPVSQVWMTVSWAKLLPHLRDSRIRNTNLSMPISILFNSISAIKPNCLDISSFCR